jgi:hypothetical protein
MWELILLIMLLGFAFVGFLVTFGFAFIYCLHTYYDWQFKRSRNERD